MTLLIMDDIYLTKLSCRERCCADETRNPAARRPECLGDQRLTESDAKWLYQALVGGREKERQDEERGKR